MSSSCKESVYWNVIHQLSALLFNVHAVLTIYEALTRHLISEKSLEQRLTYRNIGYR
jgi:hypothetical protein